MSRSGSAYATPDTISYTYNDRSELTGASSNVDTTYTYSYAYDPIGNRTTASEAGVPWTYTANNLNQYTSATENNDNLSFSYDLDGSMTYRPVDATNGWTQVWNGENRMVETFKGNDRLTFKYDYMGRRVEKCVYSGNTLTSKTLFVYDSFKCVEELEGLNSNAVAMRHAWQPFDVGLDVILATVDTNGASYFLHDANKNAMQKADINGLLQSHHVYAPYGSANTVLSTHIGYSSEITDDQTSLSYYNYRCYQYDIGRWIQREPIGEINSQNLYFFVKNQPISFWDMFGLKQCSPISNYIPDGKWEIYYIAPHNDGDAIGTIPGYSQPDMDFTYVLQAKQIYNCSCICPHTNFNATRYLVFAKTITVISNDACRDIIWTSPGIKPWAHLPVPRNTPTLRELIGELIGMLIGKKVTPQFPVEVSTYLQKLIKDNRPSRYPIDGDIITDSGIPAIPCNN